MNFDMKFWNLIQKLYLIQEKDIQNCQTGNEIHKQTVDSQSVTGSFAVCY